MSSLSDDLLSFLGVVEKVAEAVVDDPASLSEGRKSLATTGLLSLGQDTAQEEDSLQWLTNTVRVASQSSPSLGFVLAARYAADRALREPAEALEPTFALFTDQSATVAATALVPDTVVLLDVDSARLRTLAWNDLASVRSEERSGLRAAQLVSVVAPDVSTEPPGSGSAALVDWDLLTGAALVGLATAAVRTTEVYVQERQQFGVPISSFAGLRALVADMHLKLDAAQALLERSTEHGAASEAVAAAAGRAATEICIDAIQAHGGYGYIEEYPVAGLLRDALSLQARSGGRRLHVARIAERALGPR